MKSLRLGPFHFGRDLRRHLGWRLRGRRRVRESGEDGQFTDSGAECGDAPLPACDGGEGGFSGFFGGGEGDEAGGSAAFFEQFQSKGDDAHGVDEHGGMTEGETRGQEGGLPPGATEEEIARFEGESGGSATGCAPGDKLCEEYGLKIDASK